jgi:hypothetical protein
MNGALGKSKFAFFGLFQNYFFNNLNFISGSLLNSNQQIEPENMHWLVIDNWISDIKSSGMPTKSLELLNDRTAVSSLSENDQFSSDEMHHFWLNSKNIRESIITGSEPFSGSMLKPTSENDRLSSSMLDLMVE